ncbi:LuxR C-terminal-related transcriptional regulator [Streptomyces sp. BK340]|uniref:helix-turn-helix transcriptional regulator n=1 Tax=Streptomyces sp. BK340 TaxID=2572903 RepID=UPI0011AA4271|nr:LuxR C-terminal-related transcriptional regulator [Streptomyces sp. BK340]TVZ94349.1 regulatory LuxR family protein [Streptomyces sp. BK340]
MSTPAHPEHGAEELCAAGSELYARALREGRLTAAEVETAPCLLKFGLLQPTVDDPSRLEPVTAAVALHELLRTSEERIADERRREARLTKTFAPLLRAQPPSAGAAGATAAIRMHSGLDRINQAISHAMADADEELLAIHSHPTHTRTPPALFALALERDQALLDRGGRIRTLYQHTLRHAPTVHTRYERLRGDAQARTLNEVTKRLLVFDRQVAFIPANTDRTLALEIRHPALVEYFVTVFDRFWHLATPLYPQTVQKASPNGITPRQQAIAALLVEGHADAAIANRLGLNVRTARVHIAKLAATLGSESRTQLGYLIACSGILDQES